MSTDVIWLILQRRVTSFHCHGRSSWLSDKGCDNYLGFGYKFMCVWSQTRLINAAWGRENTLVEKQTLRERLKSDKKIFFLTKTDHSEYLS